MRARFPKVLNLDGTSIPPPIEFDLGEHSLPDTKDGCIPDHLKEFVETFIKKYFGLFDSDNRQQLLDMYYEKSNFSYTINRFDQRAKQKMFDMSMLSESRNLLRINENQRTKLLKQGRASVVAALSNLPQTEHILQSFKLDVPLFDNSYIVLNIIGLYKTKRPYNLKAFSRNFFITSHGNSFAIVNDLLSITNPSVENVNFVKNLYKNDPNSQDVNFMESMDEFGMGESVNQMNQLSQVNQANQLNQVNQANQMNLMNHNTMTQMNSNQTGLNAIGLNPGNFMSAPANTGMMNQMNAVPSLRPSNEELVKRFAQITGMNLTYSRKCLEENNFDADESLKIFTTLNGQSLIPPEAFLN